MNMRPLFQALVLSTATFAAGCGGGYQARPGFPVSAELTSRGETIYFGSVFPLGASAAGPTYIYERRVDERPGGAYAAHITRDEGGAIVLADSAIHSSDYRLQDYTLHTNQLGQRGSIHVEGDQVTFRLVDEAGERSSVERQSVPVAVGPTLVGYIFRHLPDLRAGKTMPVRMAVLDRLETIGFDLQAVDAPPGQTRVRMKASSFLIAAVIDPITFTFETATGKLARLEGRVPTKLRTGDCLRDLDARVEYRYLARAYR